MKTCSHCGLEKASDSFHSDRRSKDGLTRKCKACTSTYQEQYRAQNREMVLAKKRAYRKANREAEAVRHRAWAEKNHKSNVSYHRDWHLLRKYNLSAVEWDAMFEAQGRICAICGDPKSHSRNGWHTDHCHETNQVRGILCHHCNIALGHIRDSPDLALKLYSYLSGKLPFAA